jgi:hypothetical protein
VPHEILAQQAPGADAVGAFCFVLHHSPHGSGATLERLQVRQCFSAYERAGTLGVWALRSPFSSFSLASSLFWPPRNEQGAQLVATLDREQPVQSISNGNVMGGCSRPVSLALCAGVGSSL